MGINNSSKKKVPVYIVTSDVLVGSSYREYMELEDFSWEIYLITDISQGELKELTEGIIVCMERSDKKSMETLRSIRKQTDLPVMILSMEDTVFWEQQFLQEGAMEYQSIDKPIAILGLRMSRILLSQDPGSMERHQGVLYEAKEQKRFYLQGEPLLLTEKEYGVLHVLVRQKGMVLSREQILWEVWGTEYNGDPRTVDTIVKQLRHKLGVQKDMIQNIYGKGYSIRLS